MVVAIFALLAGIVARETPAAPSGDLAAGGSETLRARVVELLEEGISTQGEFEQPYQRLRLRLSGGVLDGQEVKVEHGLLGLTNKSRMFRAGDRVLVEHSRTPDGEELFYVTDYVRTRPPMWLALLFVAATLLLSGW